MQPDAIIPILRLIAWNIPDPNIEQCVVANRRVGIIVLAQAKIAVEAYSVGPVATG